MSFWTSLAARALGPQIRSLKSGAHYAEEVLHIQKWGLVSGNIDAVGQAALIEATWLGEVFAIPADLTKELATVVANVENNWQAILTASLPITGGSWAEKAGAEAAALAGDQDWFAPSRHAAEAFIQKYGALSGLKV